VFAGAGRAIWAAVVLQCLLFGLERAIGGGPDQHDARIVEMAGTVDFSPAGKNTWAPARTNLDLHPFDRVRTGARSRTALQWSDQTVLAFGEATEFEILPPNTTDAEAGLHLIRGLASFFHRDKPGRIRILTPGTVAGVVGTEFVLGVNDTERTTLSVIDGKVSFGNDQATLVLTNGQQAFADVGQAPVRTAGFIVNNALQWSFYYPAVLDLADLTFTPAEQTALEDSLTAYRAGDLLAALANYPPARTAGSDAERIYYAALLLAVGNVDAANGQLASVNAGGASDRSQRLAGALRDLVFAVKRQADPAIQQPQFPTEFLAQSYYQQSRAIPRVSLSAALALAKQAATNSPQFGFAWERVAELEFSFGHIGGAMDALDRSLALSPRNAQALTLKGFLLAEENNTKEAGAFFNRAITVDSALGNAWLGRGLIRIRRGDAVGGREDLLVAAALEPQRAELRSYLGKAYASAGDYTRARKELGLAEALDPADPTPWLYSALLNQDDNRINEAIRDLEKSQSLNDNRGVYRSQLLLDQDRAVRSDNLATVYQDAGMSDPSFREAVRAVNLNYADYSAHLFLANSLAGMEDPNGISLRYETAKESEYLLANLLSPSAAGVISPTISQQEYTRMFESDRYGFASETEYLSRGAWSEAGAEYGILGDFSYDLEANYSSDPGQRVNNDLQERDLSVTLKQQFGPADTVYLRVLEYEANGGDLHQYYYQSMANPIIRFSETQEPTITLGYHHEWTPGIHTLFLFGRINDHYSFSDATQPTLVFFLRPSGVVATADGVTMNEVFDSEQTIYSGELQHIWQGVEHNTIIGARFQYGDFETGNAQDAPSGNVSAVFPRAPTNTADQNINTYFARASLYGYHDWQILDSWQLFGGVTYDWMKFPANIQTAPISSQEETTSHVSPKAGVIWSPWNGTTVRSAYTRSMGGTSLDQSYQIEPSQVAGFLQSFRSLIPESVAAESPAAGFETYGISLEQRFDTGTYLAVEGDLLNSKNTSTVGDFDVTRFTTYGAPSGATENLDYHENSLLLNANQLLGREWSVGAQYRVSQAELNETFPAVPGNARLFDFLPHQQIQSILHQSQLFITYNNAKGFFATGEALWNSQNNAGYSSATLPGDSFWQFNAFAGYRFLHRKAELRVGLLNIGNQDYNLNPLNLHPEFPHQRTLDLRLRLNF